MSEENRFQRYGQTPDINKILRDLQSLDKEVKALTARIKVLESKS